ncbi:MULTISPECIES: hypothetical protein [unclassified Rathayibacter]|uniref:hypothetical protein n=1 Tax=unclassified Rathayibacter TaxID=2609250 RepID=UPI0006F1E789|nr:MULTISPECIES: hypothetical protein [unclassified Rathayibacter]KQQ05519.1 hypothetical protein ASF42_02765 [Rathayibacter sp. Leaf294]KQS13381.1 hypothetical protein ASG06_02775 [Rathayibacter sp. Leaf185]
MTDIDDPRGGGRREELIAAALAGELSAAEGAELDLLRASDPSIDRELALFGVVLADLRTVGRWDEVAPSDDLRRRIQSLAGVAPIARGRGALLIGAAAACLALGAVGGAGLYLLGDRPVEGAPGQLGAVETIAFDGAPEGIDIDGSLIAHTWGTETILRASGFAVGESYDLVLVTDEGERLPSGSFLGSAVEIDCEMNAAILRDSVSAIEITDDSGETIAVADLPPVAT